MADLTATGTIQITPDLALKNPTLEIVKCNYDWVANEVAIEIHFSEGAYKHSRTFTYSTDGSGELTTADILAFINNDTVLNVFV